MKTHGSDDWFERTPQARRLPYLRIMASDLTRTGSYVFDIHSDRDCVDDEDSDSNLQLSVAVAASSAVPFLFSPVMCHHRVFVDGGTTDNYPTSMYTNPSEDDLDATPWFIGFRFWDDVPKITPASWKWMETTEYLRRLVIASQYHAYSEAFKLLSASVRQRTVLLPCTMSSMTSFICASPSEITTIKRQGRSGFFWFLFRDFIVFAARVWLAELIPALD